LDALRAECEQGASFGFTGKQTIHPNQIPVIHEAFSPSKESVQHATRLLQQYIKEVAGKKRGAWEFEGKMVDQPVIRKAKKTLELGVAYNIEKSEAEPVLNEVKEIDGENDNRRELKE
jgi:citrate lyase beta subunit